MNECEMTLNSPMTHDDWAKITDANMEHTTSVMFQTEGGKGVEFVKVVRCKDCRYYCVKDFWADFHGVPILAASDVPTCNKWANTESKVDPDGFCFLAEKLDRSDEK